MQNVSKKFKVTLIIKKRKKERKIFYKMESDVPLLKETEACIRFGLA